MHDAALNSLTDEALAGRAVDGSVHAYEELDRRYRARLVHLLRGRRAGLSEADAEDAAQQALWTAYHRLDRYDRSRRFSTWLFTIALRKGVDLQRAEGRRPHVGAESTEPLASASPGPLERLIRRDQADNLWTLAQDALKPSHFTALWLHYGEGQSPPEVARAMGITSVNARVLLHRARKALAGVLRAASAEARPPSAPLPGALTRAPVEA